MFVKDRTGRTRTVADGYILQHGESLVMTMMTFDSAPRPRSESSDDLYRRLVCDRAEKAAPVAIPSRNGPPVVIKDGTGHSDEFAKGAAFASRLHYERRISDAWKHPVDPVIRCDG